jgi:hypothetical protein
MIGSMPGRRYRTRAPHGVADNLRQAGVRRGIPRYGSTAAVARSPDLASEKSRVAHGPLNGNDCAWRSGLTIQAPQAAACSLRGLLTARCDTLPSSDRRRTLFSTRPGTNCSVDRDARTRAGRCAGQDGVKCCGNLSVPALSRDWGRRPPDCVRFTSCFYRDPATHDYS